MAKFKFENGVRNGLDIKFLGKPRSDGRVFTQNQSQGIGQFVNSLVQSMQTDHLIPEDMISNVGNVATSLYGSRQVDLNVGGKSRLSRKAEEIIANQIFSVGVAYRNYYMSWLKGVGSFLNNPNLPTHTSPANFKFAKYVDVKKSKRHKSRRIFNLFDAPEFTLHPDIRDLATSTKAIKKELSDPKGKGLWRHTGKLARAYSNKRLELFKKLEVGDFVTKGTTTLIGLNENRRFRLGKPGRELRYARSVRYTFKLGIPSWDNGGFLDTIFVNPYAGQTPGGVGQFLPSILRGGKNRGSFFKYKNANADPKGIKRILNPEFRRPVLREASFAAGKIARAHLAHRLRNI